MNFSNWLLLGSSSLISRITKVGQDYLLLQLLQKHISMMQYKEKDISITF